MLGEAFLDARPRPGRLLVVQRSGPDMQGTMHDEAFRDARPRRGRLLSYNAVKKKHGLQRVF